VPGSSERRFVSGKIVLKTLQVMTVKLALTPLKLIPRFLTIEMCLRHLKYLREKLTMLKSLQAPLWTNTLARSSTMAKEENSKFSSNARTFKNADPSNLEVLTTL